MRTLLSVLLLLILSWSWPSYATQNLRGEENISSLKGFDSAALRIVGFDQDTQAIGLSESDVRNVVRPALEQLGVKIISIDEASKSPSVPVFTAYINVFRSNWDSSYSYSISFEQIVRRVNNEKLSIHVPTWSFGGQGMAHNATAASQILKALREPMQVFRQDYQRANLNK